MMQPGSKGGYFTDKSPKLLLLEWCQQQKRAKPRYKDLPQAGNLHKCRVCLLLCSALLWLPRTFCT